MDNLSPDTALPFCHSEYRWMMREKVGPTAQQVADFEETGTVFLVCVHYCPCLPPPVSELARRELARVVADGSSVRDLHHPLEAELTAATGHLYRSHDFLTVRRLPEFKVGAIVSLGSTEDLNTFVSEHGILCNSTTVPQGHYFWPVHYVFFEVAWDEYVLISVYQPEVYDTWQRSNSEEQVPAVDDDEAGEDAEKEAAAAAPDSDQAHDDAEEEEDSDQARDDAEEEESDEENGGDPLPPWLLHPGGNLYVEALAAEAEECIPHAEYEGTARRCLF